MLFCHFYSRSQTFYVSFFFLDVTTRAYLQHLKVHLLAYLPSLLEATIPLVTASNLIPLLSEQKDPFVLGCLYLDVAASKSVRFLNLCGRVAFTLSESLRLRFCERREIVTFKWIFVSRHESVSYRCIVWDASGY